MSQEEFTCLVQLIEANAPTLLRLLTKVVNTEMKTKDGGTLIPCKKVWKDFIEALSSASPVCALIPPKKEVIDLLNEMQNSDSFKSNPCKLSLLQKEVPTLFKLVENVTHYPTDAIQPVLARLTILSQTPFLSSHGQSEDQKTVISETFTSQEDSLHYFPHLPVLRKRKHYVSDQSRSSTCSKKSSRHPTLLPGIFTLYCQHGKVYVEGVVLKKLQTFFYSTGLANTSACTFCQKPACFYYNSFSSECRYMLWIPSNASSGVTKHSIFHSV